MHIEPKTLLFSLKFKLKLTLEHKHSRKKVEKGKIPFPNLEKIGLLLNADKTEILNLVSNVKKVYEVEYI